MFLRTMASLHEDVLLLLLFIRLGRPYLYNPPPNTVQIGHLFISLIEKKNSINI